MLTLWTCTRWNRLTEWKVSSYLFATITSLFPQIYILSTIWLLGKQIIKFLPHLSPLKLLTKLSIGLKTQIMSYLSQKLRKFRKLRINLKTIVICMTIHWKKRRVNLNIQSFLSSTFKNLQATGYLIIQLWK